MKKVSLLILTLCFLASYNGKAQFAQGEVLDTISLRPISDIIDDLDGDLDLDFVVLHADKLVWFENDGSGDLGEEITIFSDFEHWDNIKLSDIDNDGLKDIILNYKLAEVGKISWFKNEGDGTFTENEIIAEKANDIVINDLDEDGHSDLIYLTDSEIKLAENTGGGTYLSPVTLITGLTSTTNLYLNDFDADGDQDIVHSEDWGSGGTFYTENLGEEVYGTPDLFISYMDVFNPTDIVLFSDLDDDGDDDWIVKYGFEGDFGNIEYYQNTGGSLAAPMPISYSSGSITMADVNNDGMQDLIAGEGATWFKWYEGNGDGTFETSVELVAPDSDWESGDLNGPTNIIAADINGDGDLEIIGDMSLDYYMLTVYDNLVIDENSALGKVFVDINENEIQDIDEPGAHFILINSTPEEVTTYTYDDGNYIVSFPPTDDIAYEITPNLPEYWAISTDSLSYLLLTEGEIIDSLDFGIYPTTIIDSIQNDLSGASPRCNDTINYWITTANKGTTVPSGIVHLELDEDIEYISASILPDSIVEQNIYWHYDSLLWFSDTQINVQVQMPDFLSEGDTVTSHIYSSVDSLDGAVFSATNSLAQIITCAYDPNDKIAYPSGTDEPGYIALATEVIDYTVRFQNTGSDTAINVLIIDELDLNLDWTSVEILANSHPVEMELDEGELSFIFDNIMLPDSNVNEVASHGFIKYRINLNEGLTHGTIIENTADIYFDANPAIITNTKVHTIFDCDEILSHVTITETVCFGDTLYGAIEDLTMPSTTLITWTVDGLSVTSDACYYLPEEAGSFEMTVSATTGFCEASTSIDFDVLPAVGITELSPITICSGDSTLIFGTYQTVSGTYYETLITTDGCDSIRAQQLIANSPEVEFTSLEDETMCLDQGVVSLVSSPAGGTFTGVGVIGTDFDPALASEGMYTLYYTFEDDDGCIGTDSISVSVVDCLGLDDETTSDITVYPNPFTTYTIINFNQDLKTDCEIAIYDTNGKKVYSKKAQNVNSIKIEKGELPAGIYLLTLTEYADQKELFSTKLIIQ